MRILYCGLLTFGHVFMLSKYDPAHSSLFAGQVQVLSRTYVPFYLKEFAFYCIYIFFKIFIYLKYVHAEEKLRGFGYLILAAQEKVDQCKAYRL